MTEAHWYCNFDGELGPTKIDGNELWENPNLAINMEAVFFWKLAVENEEDVGESQRQASRFVT